MNGNSNLGIGIKEELECPETPVNEENPAKVNTNKRVFTLNEKAALINCCENEGLSVKELAEKFKCGKTSVYETLKRKSEIFEQCGLGAGSRKRRLRKTGNEDINKAVWQWFLEAKSNNFNITGRVLQAQAKLAAERLGRQDFKASNGWLESFRTRHAINFKQPIAGSSQEQLMNQNEWNSYNEMDTLIEVKEELEDTDPGFELQDTETIDLLSSSSPLPSRGDEESDSSYPTTTNISGSLGLPPTRSQPMALLCENSPDQLPELPKQHSVDEEQHEEERTLETLQLSEQERQRRLEILEKEHEMKMDILRIEKETAEINRDIARRQHLWQSEKFKQDGQKEKHRHSDRDLHNGPAHGLLPHWTTLGFISLARNKPVTSPHWSGRAACEAVLCSWLTSRHRIQVSSSISYLLIEFAQSCACMFGSSNNQLLFQTFLS